MDARTYATDFPMKDCIGPPKTVEPRGSGGLTTPGAPMPNSLWGPYTGGRNGVSKEIEDDRRPPTLQANHP
jgi:hypothetical protein